MDQNYDDFFAIAQKATDKGKFLKLPRLHMNLKYNFYGLYTHQNSPLRPAWQDSSTAWQMAPSKWSPTSTTHCNHTRRVLNFDSYGVKR